MKHSPYVKSRIRKIHSREISVETAFEELAGFFSGQEGTVLLMSGGEHESTAQHLLAAEPWLRIRSKHRQVEIREREEVLQVEGNPFDILQEILSHYRFTEPGFDSLIGDEEADIRAGQAGRGMLHSPVQAGLFGYLSYDLKDQIERIPSSTIDDLALPDLFLTAPRLLVTEERSSGRRFAHVTEIAGDPEGLAESYFELIARAESMAEAALSPTGEQGEFGISAAGFASNFNRQDYERAVADIIEYIKQGDIYQVNMSQRFSADFYGSSFALFKELYRENPAAFFAYLNCGDHQIVSTSPERFILQEGRRVEARPIKGTRPRGVTPEEDERLRTELQNSFKDDAELSMIVDLLRNDIGKVCKAGSVQVTAHKSLEAYRNVYHLVSTIQGYLDEDKDSIDLIKAGFPGGSITGCPKVRSMEIIDEKEPYKRHIYTGSIGYIGFNGRMDLSIVIRTATIKGGKVFFSVGGGIVYDSDPAEEYEETLHKAQSLMKVLGRKKTEGREEGRQVAEPQSPPGSAPDELRFCWHNGLFLPEREAMISALSPGYQYGKGLFETIRVVEGKAKYLFEHLQRLEHGCRELFGTGADSSAGASSFEEAGSLPPLDWPDLISLLTEKNGLNGRTAVVKIMVSEGKSGPLYDKNITITCRAYHPREAIQRNGGLKLIVYPQPRESLWADFKTLNYLFYLKAGEWAKNQGFDEAVILNSDGSVSETNTGNLLLLQDRRVIVPESPHRLPGIMEAQTIERYRRQGFQVSSRRVFPEELGGAPTVLVTNSLIGAVEAISIKLSFE